MGGKKQESAAANNPMNAQFPRLLERGAAGWSVGGRKKSWSWIGLPLHNGFLLSANNDIFRTKHRALSKPEDSTGLSRRQLLFVDGELLLLLLVVVGG